MLKYGFPVATKRLATKSLVALPMLGRVESLNAGASAAVLLYEVQRQRGFTPR